MPTKFKIKFPKAVTVEDGGELEIERSQIVAAPDGVLILDPGQVPPGFVSTENHETAIAKAKEEAVKDRLKNHVTLDEAAKDDAVIAAVLEANGKVDEAELRTTLLKQITEEQVAPQKERIETLLKTLRTDGIRAAVSTLGFKPEYLVAAPGARSVAENLVDGFADFDDETGQLYYAERDTGGKMVRPTGPAGEPYILLSKAGDRLRGNEEYTDLFVPPGTQSAADVTLSKTSTNGTSDEARMKELNAMRRG